MRSVENLSDAVMAANRLEAGVVARDVLSTKTELSFAKLATAAVVGVGLIWLAVHGDTVAQETSEVAKM